MLLSHPSFDRLRTQEEMFWLWEQFPQGGSRTCEAVVYDWPLLQVGYISNGKNNGTRIDTCQQCPDDALLVGQTLNADPYGIALPSEHPLFDFLQEKSLAVIRKADFRQQLLAKWRLGMVSREDQAIDFEGDWELSKLLALYYLYAFLGLIAFSIIWCLSFRSLRAKLDMRKIDARLQDSDTTSYLLQETALLDSSAVHLSEDYGLIHEIRVQINRVQAAVAQLMRCHEIAIISAPGHEPDDVNAQHRRHPQGENRHRYGVARREEALRGFGDGGGAVPNPTALERISVQHPPPPVTAPPHIPPDAQPKLIYVDTLNSNMSISFPSLKVTARS